MRALLAIVLTACCTATAPAPDDLAAPELARAGDFAEQLGAPCRANADCAPPLICGAAYGFGAPWAYCTLFCGLSTPAGTGCPEGWSCLRVVDARYDGGDASSFACIRN